MLDKSVATVLVSSDVYTACLAHALSTESEEVMGLLFGYMDDEILKVVSLAVLRRLDKRKDRVEIAPEDMARCIEIAEKLTQEEGNSPKGKREVTVVGWYHSHPHITVFPSAVDLRTQYEHQAMLHTNFIGLIFSVYDSTSTSASNQSGNDSARKTAAGAGASVSRHKLIAFQTRGSPGDFQQSIIPVAVLPRCAGDMYWMKKSTLEAWLEIAKLTRTEEQEAFEKHKGGDLTTQVHNESVWRSQVCRFARDCWLPILSEFERFAAIPQTHTKRQTKKKARAEA